jgi:hypothetical protein
VKEDLTIRDMTDLMETMNGDHILIASRMTEAVITGLTEIAKTVPAMTIVTEDMVIVTEGMAIATEDITITVMEEDTVTTALLLMGTTVLLTEMEIIITVHTGIMIASTIALLVRKDIMTGL